MSDPYGHSGGDEIGKEMVAAYTVTIEGVDRTRKEIEKLDNAIRRLRQANYSTAVPSVTVAAQAGSSDILVTKYDDLIGRVQSGAEAAMSKGMAMGRRTQAAALDKAETKTGRSGRPSRRKSAGRNVDGDMIKAIRTNVEIIKSFGSTRITGWHGWSTDERRYFRIQEKGWKGGGKQGHPGIPAANSLGSAIVPVREFLRRELEKLKR